LNDPIQLSNHYVRDVTNSLHCTRTPLSSVALILAEQFTVAIFTQ